MDPVGIDIAFDLLQGKMHSGAGVQTYSDMKTLRQLYVSLVQPHMEYAAAV